MAAELLATPAQLRLWLQLEADDVDVLPDDLADLAISGASATALAYMNRGDTFTAPEEPITIRLNGTGARTLIVPIAPIIDLVSVVLDPDEIDGDANDITDGVEWDTDGILEIGGRWPLRRRYIAVTLRAGYDTVKEDVRNVILRIAARAFSNPEGLTNESVEGYTAGFAFDATRLATLTDPDRLDLNPYRLY